MSDTATDTERRLSDLAAYYDTSIPPDLLVPPATGATAGIPGSWTPAGAKPPASPAALSQGNPVTVVASPATAWTTGQYVQTATAGLPGRATWSGSAWVSGAAPLAAEAPPSSGSGSGSTPTKRSRSPRV